MSLQDYDPMSPKRKGQLPGSIDNGEGSGRRYPRPGGLEIGRSTTPAQDVPSQGQELDSM